MNESHYHSSCLECVDDEDEVIVIIAEELGAGRLLVHYHSLKIHPIEFTFCVGKLCGYVGGASHVHKLLPPLEMLICGEDSMVRSAVSHSSDTNNYCNTIIGSLHYLLDRN